MNNRIGILINFKNRTVVTYVAVVVIAPLLISGLVEYGLLQKILEVATQIVAILGILDNPNTNQYFKNNRRNLKMGQNLALPYRGLHRITAAWKVKAYPSSGYGTHFGQDIVNSMAAGVKANIYACGNGTVVKTGWDNKLGGTVVIKYPQVYNHTTKKTQDVVARCWHMSSVASLKEGQSVTMNTLLGVSGDKGPATGVHLHIEFDTDTAYPCYSPSIGSSSNIIKKGTDSTVDPCQLFHIKTTSPQTQSMYKGNVDNYWVYSNDVNLPSWL